MSNFIKIAIIGKLASGKSSVTIRFINNQKKKSIT